MRVSLAAAAVPAAALTILGGAGATTAPGLLYHVPVTVTGSKLVIAKDRFARAGVTRYPRGAVIEFDVKNKEPAAITVRLLLGGHKLTGTANGGRPIVPDRVGHLKASFYYRGSFELQASSRGKVRASHRIVIF